MPQFAGSTRCSDHGNVTRGLACSRSGYSKKISRRQYCAICRRASSTQRRLGHAVASFEAWIGALAYAMQIYFDFSGYSDMAIGIALLFGYRLPLNFNSPYKARQHHRFLAALAHDAVALPARLSLHPARRQPPRRVRRRYRNLMLTMLLGGLWHGAAWTFVVWGALHGAYLCVPPPLARCPVAATDRRLWKARPRLGLDRHLRW